MRTPPVHPLCPPRADTSGVSPPAGVDRGAPRVTPRLRGGLLGTQLPRKSGKGRIIRPGAGRGESWGASGGSICAKKKPGAGQPFCWSTIPAR
jgi:hypothetical protein